MQIFVKSNRQWAMRRLRRGEAARFRDGCARHGIHPVLAHASYLVNLASGDAELRVRSWRACRAELRRCQRLGIAGLVVHPGSCGDQPRARALERLEASVAALTRGIVGNTTAAGGDRRPGHGARRVPRRAGRGCTVLWRGPHRGLPGQLPPARGRPPPRHAPPGAPDPGRARPCDRLRPHPRYSSERLPGRCRLAARPPRREPGRSAAP